MDKRARARAGRRQARSVGDYLLRVTFGTTLFVSIAVVYTLIFALLSSSSRDDNRRESRGGGGRMHFYLGSPFDYLWYWDPYYYQARAGTSRARTCPAAHAQPRRLCVAVPRRSGGGRG